MKYYKIIFFAIGLLLTFGCEKFPVGNAFLEKAPGVDVTKDSIFLKAEYTERFLWGAYQTLPYNVNTANNGWKNKMSHDLLESLTDLTHSYLSWGGPTTLYYSGLYNSATENSSSATKYHLTQEHSYDGIRRAYILIENIHMTPDMDAAYKNQLKAEARMIQAIHYTELFRHYGGVLWLSNSFSPEDDFSNIPRLTARATCDSIVALCNKAMVDLPWKIDNLPEWDGRFTKASAMALKARVMLFNASPLFNASAPFLDGEASQQNLTWHGGYDANLWKDAADAAEALITQAESTGDYGLFDNNIAADGLRKNWHDAYYDRGTGETLISIRDMFRTASGWDYTFYWSSFGWGSTNPTHTYVNMFPMASGLPITDPASGYDPDNPFANRDPRLYETIILNGDYYRGRVAELWIGGRERRNEGGTQARSGYIIRKFQCDRDGNSANGTITHFPYIRMPEIYLTYAEAINEFDGGPTAEAYRCVNIVRNRVGLGDLPAGLSQAEFREAVLLERALEFCMEEVRWFDLIRWKREDIFKQTLLGMNIWGDSNAGPFTYEVWDLPKRFWVDNWSPKWYLSAFPVNEVNKRYGLVQNPGWE